MSKNITKQHEGFVDLEDYHPNIQIMPRYATTYNFVGQVLHGYKKRTVYVSWAIAKSLDKIAQTLAQLGYGIVVYDSYRPSKAVDHYISWINDKGPGAFINKQLYYPLIDKEQMIPLDYLAEKCTHSKGTAIDLTIIKHGRSVTPLEKMVAQEIKLENSERSIKFLDDGTEFMGTHFDFFDESSHHGTNLITSEASKNREVLRKVMVENGYQQFEKQWWHYDLLEQPYPNTFFDFDIE